jgi:hypothetical protein
VSDLAAPVPVLAYDGAPAGPATLEQPVDVLVGPVTSGGAVVGPEALRTFAYFVYRRVGSGAALDIWDDGAKVWTSELDTGAARTPVQLAYQVGEPEPWRGILIAAGGRDSAGNPQFAKAAGGYPHYAVRAFFASAQGAEAVLTGPSATFTFVSTSDKNLVVMGPGDDEEAADATQARVLLKNTSLQTIGSLQIERSSPGARVTLGNAAGASIVLHPDGTIELTPAAGQRVVVTSDLETEHIVYLPSGGAVKQTLV